MATGAAADRIYVGSNPTPGFPGALSYAGHRCLKDKAFS